MTEKKIIKPKLMCAGATFSNMCDRFVKDGYKFRDYYSNFDLENNPLNLNDHTDISQYDIYDNYKIKASQIEQMKMDVYDSFVKSVEKVVNE